MNKKRNRGLIARGSSPKAEFVADSWCLRQPADSQILDPLAHHRSATFHIPLFLPNRNRITWSKARGRPAEIIVTVSVQVQVAASSEMNSSETGQSSVTVASGFSLKNLPHSFALAVLTPATWSIPTSCIASA